MDIRIDSLRKQYGQSPALHGIDLAIGSGELLGLLGPSGSGKTTLLRTIAGLETPTSGRIFFGGEDASLKTVQERRVGFVFQSYALFRHMTIADNIAYGLRAQPRRERPTSARIAARVEELLALMRLDGLGGRFPTQLSGGQRQRVALARALAVEPRVLLLDEPFGALDAQVRKDLRRWLRELHDQTGHTTIFVTHDQDEALELSDRVAVLHRGRIEQLGSPHEVYETPASPFVFGFIGESNRLAVTVADGRVVCGSRSVTADAAHLPNGDAVLFFRPQHAVLEDVSHADVLPAAVVGVHAVGPATRALLRLDSGQDIEVDVPAAVRVERGERIGVRVTRCAVFGTGEGDQG